MSRICAYSCRLTSPFKIVLINAIFIVASEFESTISLEITLLIKEFSIVPLATVVAVLLLLPN